MDDVEEKLEANNGISKDVKNKPVREITSDEDLTLNKHYTEIIQGKTKKLFVKVAKNEGTIEDAYDLLENLDYDTTPLNILPPT